MVSKRRNDKRSIRRRSPKRPPKYRILVVCEGSVTEPEYFRALQHYARNPRVQVKVPDEPGVPLTVVKTAIRLSEEAVADAKGQRDENLRYDSVWAVFDVDAHPNLQQAIELADRNGIQVGLSNPCFELWALIHFVEHRAHVERAKVASLLRKFLPKYQKHLDIEALEPGYGEAVKRAMALEVEGAQHGDSRRNPSTAAYKLTEMIRFK